VANAGTRGHALHHAGFDMPDIPLTVGMLHPAREHVGQDLHVPMSMFREPGAGRDPILVDDPQAAESHMLRVIVMGEAERVGGLQPSVVGHAAFLSLSNRDHRSGFRGLQVLPAHRHDISYDK